MGNCLDFISSWLRPAPDIQLPSKVSINCACFSSRVIDDTDSASNGAENEKKEESICSGDEIYSTG
jgi:hypothetical protein